VTGPYDLTPGTYSIEVVGYIGDGDAAVGTVATQTITANTTTTTATITLVAYDPVTGGGTGTFSWDITSTVHDLTSAKMSFIRIQPTGSVPPLPAVPALVDFIESGKWTNSITTFPAGYYWVDFALIAKGTTRTFRHILIIYKNQTTSFSYQFDDSYFIYAKAELPPIVYPGFDDKKPVLEYDDGSPQGTIAEGDHVLLSLTNDTYPDKIDIEVTNESIYTTIQWFLNSHGTSALTTTQGVGGSSKGEILTVDTTDNTGLFAVQGVYQLTVVGTASGVPYSKFIYLEIKP